MSVHTIYMNPESMAALSANALCTLGTNEGQKILKHCYIRFKNHPEEQYRILQYVHEINWYLKTITMLICGGPAGLHMEGEVIRLLWDLLEENGKKKNYWTNTWNPNLHRVSPTSVALMFAEFIKSIFTSLRDRLEYDFDKEWTNYVILEVEKSNEKLLQKMKQLPRVNEGKLVRIGMVVDTTKIQ